MSGPDMDQARRWLELVRADGDLGSKARYLRERGFSEEQVDELIAEERAAAGCPSCEGP